MKSYISFEVENFIKDYHYNRRQLDSFRERLAEIPEIPGMDTSREKVQTSSTGSPVEEQAITRLYIEGEIAALEDYFRRWERAYNSLDEEDRFIVDAYRDGGRYVVDSLCYDLGLEKTRVYELRRRAFNNFARFAI